MAILAAVYALALVVLGTALYRAVARDDAHRAMVDERLWVRSLEDYRRRAAERARRTPRPDPAYCGAMRRRPIPADWRAAPARYDTAAGVTAPDGGSSRLGPLGGPRLTNT